MANPFAGYIQVRDLEGRLAKIFQTLGIPMRKGEGIVHVPSWVAELLHDHPDVSRLKDLDHTTAEERRTAMEILDEAGTSEADRKAVSMEAIFASRRRDKDDA